MRIGILRIGEVDAQVIDYVKDGLRQIFPKSSCNVIKKIFPAPRNSYNVSRRQYHSSVILAEMSKYAKKLEFDRILGITEKDLYVPGLNFVFGEAQCPGKMAVISLFRLRPEFYGNPPDTKLFHERALKEAVHEVGHTLGLRHCSNSLCVMFFSNSVWDTDRKGWKFCGNCHSKVVKLVEELEDE